jgi:hypothetical protein
MAHASYTQPSFLGGEWSPSAQGRLDLPQYRFALALCRNAIVSETGSVNRRSGTRFISPTNGGENAFIYTLTLGQLENYIICETYDGSNLILNFFRGNHVVTSNDEVGISSISTGTPAEITTASPTAWGTGTHIRLQVAPLATHAWSPLVNRDFVVTKIDTTHFTLADGITNASVVGTTFVGTQPSIQAASVAGLDQNQFAGTSLVLFNVFTALQNGIMVPLAHYPGASAPQVIEVTTLQSTNTWANFQTTPLVFQDGPYEEAITDTLTLTNIAGQSYTFTAAAGDFTSAQIGDPISIAIVANLWASGTDYAATQIVVTDPITNGQFVNINTTALSATNLGNLPSTSPNFWAPYAEGAVRAWGTIASINSTTSIVITLGSGIVPLSLYFPQSYQLAKYTDKTGLWPICGVFHEGRLWFGDPDQNVEASTVFGFAAPNALMSPTDFYQEVLDSSAIDEEIIGPGANPIFWMAPDANGLLFGTQAGEWLIQASTLGNPLTPTSFQAHQFTKFGSLNLAQPVRPGLALVFIDRYAQRLMEYITDPFTQKFSGRPLNLNARGLGRQSSDGDGMLVLAYSETPDPIIWTMGEPNTLLGCTYRRLSAFTTEAPLYNAFHLHTLGSGWSFEYVCGSYTSDGSNDQPYFVTKDTNGVNYVESLYPQFTDNDTLLTAWPVDEGVTGIEFGTLQGGGNDGGPLRCGGCYGVDDGAGNIVFSGLWYFIGDTLTVWLGGLDFLDYVVAADGTITVPYASDLTQIGTQAYLESLNGTNLPPASSQWPSVSQLPNIPILISGTVYNIPGVIGFKFNTQLQRLRPDDQETARTQAGAASGQIKRHHWYSLLLAAGVNNNSLSIGTNPNETLYPVPLVDYDTGESFSATTLVSGVMRDTIESDYDLDGQMYIVLNRPGPFVLSSWTGFMEVAEI